MRLIDADVLRDRLQNLATIEGNQGVRTYWTNAYEECADMVDEQPTIEPQKWIPVSERLPEKNHLVLVSLNNFEPRVAMDEWVDEDMFWSFGRCVKAWMPLPEPYEKKE